RRSRTAGQTELQTFSMRRAGRARLQKKISAGWQCTKCLKTFRGHRDGVRHIQACSNMPSTFAGGRIGMTITNDHMDGHVGMLEDLIQEMMVPTRVDQRLIANKGTMKNKAKNAIRWVLDLLKALGLQVLAGRLAMRELLPPDSSPMGDITSPGDWSSLTGNEMWRLAAVFPFMMAPILSDPANLVSNSRASRALWVPGAEVVAVSTTQLGRFNGVAVPWIWSMPWSRPSPPSAFAPGYFYARILAALGRQLHCALLCHTPVLFCWSVAA
ncbi:unnamed protein product, partial [Pylaiella littoralis]